MNKKYLSVILFGALMLGTTGTFTSCKDYDDDINNLQEQIDKLATKEDMEAKLSQMQAAIDAAKATAEDALAKAEAAGDSKEIEALKARVQALEDAAIDVEALKAEIKASVDTQLDAFRTEMNALIEKVEGLVGKLADMVTSVELVYTSTAAAQQTLNMMTVVEKGNVFGKGLPGEITFVKDAQKQAGASFIVRVSPTNAVLTPEMISLINGEGETLDNFLNIDKVEKYNKQILGSAATPQTKADANTGLWKVSVSLKNYDKDAFNAATLEKNTSSTTGYSYIKFAVQVNNTLSTAETREVVSQYDLQIGKVDFKPLYALNYWVDAINVESIRNRYATTETAVTTNKPEWKWIGTTPDVAPAVKSDGTLVTGTDANAIQDVNDNRSGKTYIFPVVQGEPFTISIDQMFNTTATNFKSPTQVRAMYVTLDTRNAVESQPSEINAWNSYKYVGLDQVIEGTSIDVTIDGTNIIDDIIGLRVYAVNMDGTLVDPDGKAFYVRLGSTAADWNAVNTTIVPDADKSTAANTEESGKEAVTLTKLTDADNATWFDENGATPVFNAIFVDKDGNIVYNTSDKLNTFPSDFSKVTKIYTTPTNADWTKYEDNKAYKGTLVIKNAKDFVLATLNVTMTKVLPTTMPEGFSVKTAQVKDGIYNCYLVPNTWAAAQTPAATQVGTMEMKHVFNFGTGEEDQYEITFAESKMDGNKKVDNMVTGDADLTVAIDFIDNETKHATTVAYNYGNISSDANKNGKTGYKVVATDSQFETIYNCIYNNTYTWRWATREDLDLTTKDQNGNYTQPMPYSTSLTYGTDKSYTSNFAGYIQGISSWDGLYSAKLSAPYKNATDGVSLKIKKAHVISNGNKEVDEYFKVIYTADSNTITGFEATQTSSETNPTAAVESTLQITCYDMYGHEVVIELPMTVNRR